MISITIPVVSGKHLRKVLESIRSQNFQEYEVVVVNDRSDNNISEIVKEFDSKEIRMSGTLMMARYFAALASVGEFVLQLDETRILNGQEALKNLSTKKADCVFIKETENVTNMLTKAAAIDKIKSFSELSISLGKPYVLPRYYRRDILCGAFDSLKLKLGSVFSKLPGAEDLLIYHEALPRLNKIEIANAPLIVHFGDDTIRKVVRKYYRYGTHFALLSGTAYQSLGYVSIRERFGTRFNGYERFRDLILVLGLFGIRGTSFFLGKSVLQHRLKHNY